MAGLNGTWHNLTKLVLFIIQQFLLLGGKDQSICTIVHIYLVQMIIRPSPSLISGFSIIDQFLHTAKLCNVEEIVRMKLKYI